VRLGLATSNSLDNVRAVLGDETVALIRAVGRDRRVGARQGGAAAAHAARRRRARRAGALRRRRDPRHGGSARGRRRLRRRHLGLQQRRGAAAADRTWCSRTWPRWAPGAPGVGRPRCVRRYSHRPRLHAGVDADGAEVDARAGDADVGVDAAAGAAGKGSGTAARNRTPSAAGAGGRRRSGLAGWTWVVDWIMLVLLPPQRASRTAVRSVCHPRSAPGSRRRWDR
jgi:hypothetical protein